MTGTEWQLLRSLFQGNFVFLARSNANNGLDVFDPDLAIADVVGSSSLDNRVDSGINERLADHDVELDFGV
jgi:hypothetical protein